jgi:hypothetical protein
MNQALVRSNGDRFRLVSGDSDVDGRLFQIKLLAGDWERFRAVIHMSEVYGKGYSVETYVTEIVAIGARIEKIIHEHAGYARYLAHFAVFKNVCDQARTAVTAQDRRATPTAPQEVTYGALTVDLSVVFPQEIRTLVNTGFDAI